MADIAIVSFLMRVVSSVYNVFRYGNILGKYNYLKGYYYVCDQNERIYNNNPPEGIPQFLRIDIDYGTPNVLNIISKDYDRKNFKCWKTWTNDIAMIGNEGTGTYLYDKGNETGKHEYLQGKNKIVVRVIDTGKADWKKNKDNDPATQTWIRVATTMTQCMES